MALIGSIEKFNSKEMDITSYLERLEQLFVCNVVEEDKKVPMLLTLIGAEAYGVLKDILSPELPSTKSFEQLQIALTNYYSPKRLVIAERYRFYSVVQESSEDIKSFVANLKKASQHCNFGAFLPECLRDRLVCGLSSQAIKRKLLSKDNLTFERAYEIALSMELAEYQVKSMSSDVSKVEGNIDKLSIRRRQSDKSTDAKVTWRKPNQSQEWKSCFRCTRRHDSNSCPAKNWECFTCNRRGHTSKACRSAKVHLVEEDGVDEASGGKQYQEDSNSLVLGSLSKLEGFSDGLFQPHVEDSNVN